MATMIEPIKPAAPESASTSAVTSIETNRREDLIRTFIGPNADYYLAQFAKIGERPNFRLTFNPAAALFGPLWFGMRGLWAWALPFVVLETITLIQLSRGLWGDLGAPFRARAETISKILELRREQLQSAIGNGDNSVASFQRAVDSLETAAAGALADARVAEQSAVSILILGIVLTVLVKVVQGTIANWALDKRFTAWRSDRTLPSGRHRNSTIAVICFVPLVYWASIMQYTLPGSIEVLVKYPTNEIYRADTASAIKEAFRVITSHGESFFDALRAGLLTVLDALETVFVSTPWPVTTAIIVLLAGLSAGPRTGIFAGAAMTYLGVMGFWVKAMTTLALLGAAAGISIFVGVPLGIICARKPRALAFVRPILDLMQTMPAFVYLIPVIAFFGTGKPAAIVATIIYGSPPVVRLTVLGMKGVPAAVREAAISFGATWSYLLFKIDLPLAAPSIMAGINQTVMISLSMVVVASLIGAKGLGEDVLEALQFAAEGQGILAGLAILFCAMIIDRIVQGRRK